MDADWDNGLVKFSKPNVYVQKTSATMYGHGCLTPLPVNAIMSA